jgi:hypothetical protein
LLGTADEPRQERLALRVNSFLKPYVHELILSPQSRLQVNDGFADLISRSASARLHG